MKRVFLPLAIIFLFVNAASAAAPDVPTIVKHMKQGLEGPSDAVRLMTLKVNSGGNAVAEWKMVQANGTANGAHWILTVVLAPPDARGMAFLDREQPGATSAVTYVYLPATKRVLELSPLAGYDAFFSTDFAYHDLGFLRLGGRGEKLLGTEVREGKKVYKLEDHPINHPYYSKVISYVATDTLLPVERDFYDLTGRLFKSEHCTVETVAGMPTITKIVMNNLNSGGSSEIDVTKVIHDKQQPADLFDPKHLPEVADHPFWKTVTQSAIRSGGNARNLASREN
jgi:Outer membrane lipoprotein-sorting protein